MPSGPQKFWKIRDKKTGEFVTKAPPYYHLKEGEYFTTSRTGKTYSTLANAMQMLSYIAHQIDSRQYFDTWNNREEQDRKRKWVFDTVRPYLELVEFVVKEDRTIDYET